MITIDNLVKQYGDFCLNISMEIPAGTITGLIGKNGSGKSTTIKAILGLVTPDSGHITVLGKEAGHLTAADKQAIGVAFSDSGFSNYLDIEDIIHILKRLYHSFDEGTFRAACRQLDLPADKLLREFSTGMKAKLRVLVALSHGASLLIMDEPTAGLDVEARNQILDMLRGYLAEDDTRSILITSHISTDLEGLCDDVYLIHGGRLLLHEDTDRILSHYAILKADGETYGALCRDPEHSHLLHAQKEPYGYACLTDEKQYYTENYPGLVVEPAGLDELILMLTGGQ